MTKVTITRTDPGLSYCNNHYVVECNGEKREYSHHSPIEHIRDVLWMLNKGKKRKDQKIELIVVDKGKEGA